MGVRRYKPTSAGRKNMSVSTFEEITKKQPEKSLLEPMRKSGGRNSYGRINPPSWRWCTPCLPYH